jgi:hypothetical protein
MHVRTRSRTQAGLDEHNAEEEEDEDIHAEPQFANKFEKANYALQLSTIPSTMPCREVEHTHTHTHTYTHIGRGAGYIYIYIYT